ncbi:MAG: hypothetical protein ACREWJ_11700 [Rhodoferax sp.]
MDDGSVDAATAHGFVGSSLPTGRFSGRGEFAQIVREALAGAAREGWGEIIISDAGFEDWPLGERAVAESLQAWSKAGRRFTMLALRYDEVVRRHARFVSWRRTWAHIVECRRCAAADFSELPSAIWSPAWALRRLDLERSTGTCSSNSDPGHRLQVREILNEWLRKSTPGFPASTLGL